MGITFRIWKNRKTGELRSGKSDEIPKEFDPTNLVFDPNSKIVYYKFKEIDSFWACDCEKVEVLSSYMTAYYSENGKLCRFIHNQIVEI